VELLRVLSLILCHALLAAPLHLTRCRKTFFTADSLAFPDILPFPLLSRHRLSADLLALLYLHAVDEHAEVLADRDQRRVLSAPARMISAMSVEGCNAVLQLLNPP
jgi:hypothetical protein